MSEVDRRTVLAAASLAGTPPGRRRGARRSAVALVLDPADPITASAPAQAAAAALEAALRAAGFSVVAGDQRRAGQVRIIGRGPAAGQAPSAESFTLSRAGQELIAQGADPRGLSYALRALAERVRAEPDVALGLAAPISDRRINPVRSVMRQFTCEAYDKAWFHDRAGWLDYLSMLADHRFNRLHLAFGLGYDSLAHVTDSYLLFTYPYLVEVPGFDVRVTGLSDTERARNLETLKFISERTLAHGLDFQLGLWMHGYEWPAAPGVAMIEGLTPQTHADYCRAAIATLLRALPATSSVALRIHGESGVKEGSYGFWKQVFAGVADVGRPIEIDLHAKGVDAPMIDNALATSMPVNVSPKYWGEHLGLAYHQAAIREFEMPAQGQVGKGLMTLSEGARSFTRYGYADLLREDRRYTVRHRIFPGTQHLLASSADPAHGPMFGFCGSTGADLMEPLTYRGRRGSASATARSGYRARRLETTPWDWLKYEAWYRSYGRTLYNPASLPAPGGPLAKALAAASRILPLVTTAYAASAACDAYWPEAYWNQPLAAEPAPNPYADNLAPKVFDNASPLDPQLFSSMREHAAELMGQASGKVSPAQVAAWLEDFAAEAEADLVAAGRATSIGTARLRLDIEIQAALGRFFAAKLRAGVLFALFGQGQDRRAGAAAVTAYRQARTQWAHIVGLADGAYGDVSCSDIFTEHGAWADKLAGIDADLAAVEALVAPTRPGTDPAMARAIKAVAAGAAFAAPPVSHRPPAAFTPGADLELSFEIEAELASATLWFRQVNQAERWLSAPLTRVGNRWRGAVPGAYTAASAYPLQYYLQGQAGAHEAFLYPALTARPKGLPYVVLRPA